MKLMHMPEGTHDFADFGYARYPHRPLLGDAVVVHLAVENPEPDLIAKLNWQIDGETMPELIGEEITGMDPTNRYFRFSLGSFDQLSQIQYEFIVNSHDNTIISKGYSFETLQATTLSDPLHMIKSQDSAYVIFPEITIGFDWAKELRVFTLDATHKIAGDEVSSLEVEITEDVSLTIKLAPFSWLVKRYTKTLTGAEHSSYRLYLNKSGQVRHLSYNPKVTARHIVGLGERFDKVDQQGNKLSLRVVEKFTQQGTHTYLPIPFFLTEEDFGWFSSTERRLWLNAEKDLTLSFVTPESGTLTDEWWLIGQPQEVISQLHKLTGTAVLPPKWAFGLWISGNGWNTQKETLEQLVALKEHELPATAIVIEAWSDEQTFCIFNDAKYEPLPQEHPYSYRDFTFPANGKWPNPKKFAEEIQKAGLNLVLWQIPVIKYEEEEPGEQLLSDEAYAIKNGYCVLNEDGTPYRIIDHWFKNSLLLDFTNPEAVKWWFCKRKYLLTELGVKGFKTDGGEFLFDETAILHDGQKGETAHNLYPMQYAEAYQNFLKEHEVDGATFTRAGYTGAQRFPVHWAGDQLSTWGEFQAQLTAGLSAGLSGIPFWSFDIGGFAGGFPSSELYLRSVAMGAFSPVMQWHSEPRSGQFYHTERKRWNNDRSPWNLASLYNDAEIIRVYRLFANLRMNLLPYIYQEAIYSAKSARPLMAHLIVDYPEDAVVWSIHDQYMFGRDLLVAPVIWEGAVSRKIYLPQGTWHDLSSGDLYQGGQLIDYPCLLETLPVFVRDGAVIPVNLGKSKVMGSKETIGGVGNDLASYQNLGFISFGGSQLQFQDDLGTEVFLQEGRIHGKGISEVFLIDATASAKEDDCVMLFGRSLATKRIKL